MGGGNRGERDQDVPLLVLRLNTSLDADAVLATATKGTSQHSDRYCILSRYELFLQEPNLRQICAFVLQRSHTTRLVSLFCLQHSFFRCFLRRSAHRLEVVADAQPLDRRPLLAEGALGDLEQPRALLERLRHSFIRSVCVPAGVHVMHHKHEQEHPSKESSNNGQSGMLPNAEASVSRQHRWTTQGTFLRS